MIEKSILPAGWQVPKEFRDRLGKTVGRQRPMVAEKNLLLALHAPPKTEDTVRIGRFFWRSPDGTWKSNDLGSGIAALGRQLDEYGDLVAALDRQEENAKTADDYFAVLERLTPLLRAARNQHQVLQEARKECPEYRDIIDVRDRAYAIERSTELLYSETKNSLDLVVAKRAEEQAQAGRRMAESSHRLNILAAVFLPIVAITAILGIDLATLAVILGQKPESFTSGGVVPIMFIGMVIVALAFGAVLTVIVVRLPRSQQRDNFDRECFKKLQ